MRIWRKYVIGDPLAGTGRVRAQTYAEFAAQIGGVDADAASYESKDQFFARWFRGLHSGRLECYDGFLRSQLRVSDRVLSVASGRCANELKLLEDGYDVTCSDLDMAAQDATRRLFPQFRFERLDLLAEGAPEQYDAVIALGVMYAFDDHELERFFHNVLRSLKPGGQLLLDHSGATDNGLSWLLDEGLLRVEAYLRWLVRQIRSEAPGPVTTVHHGYRRTDDEIVTRATRHGLRLVVSQHFSFTHEFERSVLLSRLVKAPVFGAALRGLGRRIPYIRLFRFDLAAPAAAVMHT